MGGSDGVEGGSAGGLGGGVVGTPVTEGFVLESRKGGLGCGSTVGALLREVASGLK